MVQALYDYFNKRLDDNIRSYGEIRMARDVARLRALNQRLYEQCVLQDTGSSNNVKLDKRFNRAANNAVTGGNIPAAPDSEQMQQSRLD